jgi:hypothetical protein
MLIELPSGDWVKPERVDSIAYVFSLEDGKDYVHVTCGIKHFAFKENDKQAAQQLRDKIANQVNAALYEERSR